jgi:hypothetical protein
VELRRFFDWAIRASFHDLALRDDPAAAYLADLLTRFARTEALHPPGRAVPRLDTVVDMLLDAQAVWGEDSPYFEPERELAIRRHIGDYTLFMLGVFRERVERLASTGHYIARGTQAYRFVSEHARARGATGAPPYRRLAERFEHYAGALDYARRVHFFDHPEHPFFRLSLG